ncbi:sugar phosphate nucleotidyltransferase [Heliophilum fasciatum]|uniref:Glucose-1-phosphate cytidylyltransferase n=1 Tax=Heliophilum fasciatum TaxID=35700 RepID=A0A4R2RDR6_9FIRM|nr:sugar phosphate nucleotidyltransferase [Heliophilum fasciatum]MCW2279264.1 glucose-1-phosphate cytidylyltransferase [Heliophilum fasciatum]TCP60488.1 glucose-1-phosphate cytidylyltransferase [Heliophilum fasciatum]
MKAVILCGGKGLRMSSGSDYICKPLVKVGEMPLVWHIMNIYKKFGIKQFVLCLGYRGDAIKEYFMNMDWKNHTFRLKRENNAKDIEIFHPAEEWDIIFADTGQETMTGGRIKKIQPFIDEDNFMLTYGDAVSDINLDDLLRFHQEKGKIATVTGSRARSGYGIMKLQNDIAVDFQEKPILEGWINAGFFVLNKKVFDYISDDDRCVWEEEPLRRLVQDQELAVYQHAGFWQSVDSVKDLQAINELWNQNIRPWV